MLSPQHTNVFGLYYAVANRFTHLGMFSLSQNILSYIKLSPGCCLLPAIDLRSRQVFLQIGTRLPEVSVVRPPDFPADASMGKSYQTIYFRAITRLYVAFPPNLTDDMFMGACYQTKCLRAGTRPHSVDIAKLPFSQRTPQIVVSLLNSTGS